MAAPSSSLPDHSSLSMSSHGSVKASVPHDPERPLTSPLFSLASYFVGQEWRDSAACFDVPTDFFFPPRGEPGDEIRDLCFSCPVRLECLDDSVRTMPKFGWRGGHPKEGRTQIRRIMEQDKLDLETADAIVLGDALERVRQRKKQEKGRRFDLGIGDVVLGEHVLAS